MNLPKPISEMSVEEMDTWITKLQSEREALAAEGKARKRERITKEQRSAAGIKTPRAPSEAKQLAASMLEMMRGD